MKKICVVGSYSGRNAGDSAILEGILHDVYSLYQNVKFLVPTINKTFIERTYKQFPIKAIPMMPWNFSMKILGLPIFRAVLQSNLVLITDAILFDRELWNPIFNYLLTMALVLPMAKKKGIPVVLYNVSLGPVSSTLGKRCLQRVVDASELIIVRDRESIDLLQRLNLYRSYIKQGADCALNVLLPSPERIEEIKIKECILDEDDHYISFNINSYIDAFVKRKAKSVGIDQFVQIIAETMDKIIEEIGKKIVFVITQSMDIKIAQMVLRKVRNPQDITLITNKTYTHNELAGILSQVEMHVGMRTHSLILATASLTPTVGIVYRPKNRGFMKTIEQEDKIIEFGDSFTSQNLFLLIKKTWEERKVIREQLRPIIAREKKKARQSAAMLKDYLS